jgi:hypothetical protein
VPENVTGRQKAERQVDQTSNISSQIITSADVQWYSLLPIAITSFSPHFAALSPISREKFTDFRVILNN